MILKGIKFTGKALKKKKKPKSLKRYKTQFEDVDAYGSPVVRNVMYRSPRGLKAQRKHMDRRFSDPGGTFAVSKSKYKRFKKSNKIWKKSTEMKVRRHNIMVKSKRNQG